MGVLDDLAPFLTDLGVTATLSVGGAAVVIFDAPHAAAFDGLVSGTDPVCTGRTADLSAVTVGSTVTINAVAYTVVGIGPDGTGMTRLDLEKA